MEIFSRAEVEAALDIDHAVAEIERALIAHALGRAQVPPVGHLGFAEPPGDCHVKYGHIAGQDEFLIKVATGFYRNPQLGIPSSNGFMVLMSARTGEPLALLQEHGHLTDVRTAIAGLIAARYLAPKRPVAIGVIGTGTQARLQTELLVSRYLDCPVLVWGRDSDRTGALVTEMIAKGHAACAVASLQELCAEADVLVTTTPSRSPLIRADWIRPGTHITAVGADAPGKQELDPAIFARASVRVVDSLSQCVHHGEAGFAVRGGLIQESDLIELGRLIAAPELGRTHGEQITVADLTGVAVQDIAIARSVWQRARSLRTASQG
jgi:ornithine cyclodeaminase